MHIKVFCSKSNQLEIKLGSIGVAYTVGCPISLNNYLDFSSVPLFLIFLFFMYMNMRNVPENKYKLQVINKQDEAPTYCKMKCYSKY